MTDVPNEVSPGDIVTFVGRDGDEEITVRDLAGLLDSSTHDVLSGLSARLDRIIV